MKHHLHTHEDDVPFGPEGRVTTRTWSPATLRTHIKAWPVLESDQEKLRRIHQLNDALADSVNETTNIPVDGLLNYLAEGLNPTTSTMAQASHLALGTAEDDPQGSNDTLGNEVYRTIVGDGDTTANELLTSTFLSQTEANGYNITEIGLCGGPQPDGPLLTHALLGTGNTIEKNSSMVVTIDYILEFTRGSDSDGSSGSS